MAETKQVVKRETSTITLDLEFLTRIRLIATHHNLTNEEALVKYGGAGVDREYKRVVNERSREIGGEG